MSRLRANTITNKTANGARSNARLSTGDAATLNQTDVDNDFTISVTMMFYNT